MEKRFRNKIIFIILQSLGFFFFLGGGEWGWGEEYNKTLMLVLLLLACLFVEASSLFVALFYIVKYNLDLSIRIIIFSYVLSVCLYAKCWGCNPHL